MDSSSLRQKPYHILSGSTLKLIAIFSMLLDHIASVILWNGILQPAIFEGITISSNPYYHKLYLLYKILRKIGRIAFPIFCFSLVEGFLFTSNKRKYALRLLAFCFISEIPFDLALHKSAFYINKQNVFFTLFIGFLMLCLIEKLEQNQHFMLIFLVAAFSMGLAYVIKSDYSYKGIFLILILYLFRFQPEMQTLAGCASLYWTWPAMFAFVPINLYNGKKGISLKYFFYLFYPLHLLLLYAIKICFL